MSGIQLFQNSQTPSIIQMMWSGHITESDIEQAFIDLQQITDSLAHSANLVVVVASDTQMPDSVVPAASMPFTTNNLSGWMLIGNNHEANTLISQLIARWFPIVQPL